MIRVGIIDPHTVIRDGLRAALQVESDIQLVAEAGDAASAYALEAQLDVLIIEPGNEQLDGLGIARVFLSRAPAPKILFLSTRSDAEFLARTLAVGAQGLAVKAQPISEIVSAIRSLATGQTYLWRRAPQSHAGHPVEPHTQPSIASLSTREREVFDRLMQADSNKQIAAEFGISVRTVEAHRAHIMYKLRVRSATELFRFALENRLLQPRANSSSDRPGYPAPGNQVLSGVQRPEALFAAE